MRPWLPQPAEWRDLTAEAQAGSANAMLELYREALALRRAHLAGHDAPLRWVGPPGDVLAFERGERLACVVNLSRQPHPLSGEVMIASESLADGCLPPDAAAWIGPRPA